jgi:hypothetical protein
MRAQPRILSDPGQAVQSKAYLVLSCRFMLVGITFRVGSDLIPKIANKS